jgi:hypothetical protein
MLRGRMLLSFYQTGESFLLIVLGEPHEARSIRNYMSKPWFLEGTRRETTDLGVQINDILGRNANGPKH